MADHMVRRKQLYGRSLVLSLNLIKPRTHAYVYMYVARITEATLEMSWALGRESQAHWIESGFARI